MKKRLLSFLLVAVLIVTMMPVAVSAAEIPGKVQLWDGGPYWATTNVGAENPQDSGYYFWWGDTVGYKRNGSDNGWVSAADGTTTIEFKSDDSIAGQTANKESSYLKSNGWIDENNNLLDVHDAATKYLGDAWRMPTNEDWQALKSNCYIESTDDYRGTGVRGLIVYKAKDAEDKNKYGVVDGYSTDDLHIFLPAGGYGKESDKLTTDTLCYWSRTLDSTTPYCFKDGGINKALIDTGESYYALSVRAVSDASPTFTLTYNTNGAESGTAPTDTSKYVKDATATVLGNTGSLAKAGYVFDGWNTEADGTGTTYKENSTFSISGNTTLYVKWTKDIKITATAEKETVMVGEVIKINGTLSAGDTPINDGLVYLRVNGSTRRVSSVDGAFSFNLAGFEPGAYRIEVFYEDDGYKYDTNVTVIVLKDPGVQFLVTFDLNNGENDGPERQIVEEGKKASEPEAPTGEGVIFAGWYTDKACTDGNEYDFDSEVTKDLVLYAKWKPDLSPDPEPDPTPEPDPVEVYYTPLIADLKANEEGIIEWTAGDSLPLEAVRLLVEKPELSLEFTFTYENEEHTIFIPAGAFEQYYDVNIPWYGPAWLIQHFDKLQKDVIEYIIVKDDTLNALAEKFKCTVEEILALNSYINDKHWIYPNNKLLIPVQK